MGAVLTGDEWEEEQFYENGNAEIQRLIDEIEDLFPELPRQSALDFGCGLGRLTFNLAKHFDQVTGVDISEKMLELAKANPRAPANVSLLLNTKSDLSQLEDNQFDLSLSLIVLQHMPRKYMKAYLAELIRITKPGGIIVFQVPTLASHRYWVDKPLRSDSPSIGKLCYRAIARLLRWIPRKLKHTYLSSNLRYYHHYLKLKLTGVPVMEMNSWNKTSLEQFLDRHGTSITHLRKDPEVHAGLESFTFYTQKSTS